MSEKPLSPAERAIAAFGGVRQLARAVGRNASSISRWRLPIGSGGTGGYIPARIQRRLLDAAIRDGVEFTAADLVAEEEHPEQWENKSHAKTAAKLDKQAVKRIRRIYVKGAHGQLEKLAEEYSVGKQTIYKAATRQTWKDVP